MKKLEDGSGGNLEGSDKPFVVSKTFGLAVLLELTQKTVDGVVIKENDGKFTSNLGQDGMNEAVTKTMDDYGIRLEVPEEKI